MSVLLDCLFTDGDLSKHPSTDESVVVSERRGGPGFASFCLFLGKAQRVLAGLNMSRADLCSQCSVSFSGALSKSRCSTSSGCQNRKRAGVGLWASHHCCTACGGRFNLDPKISFGTQSVCLGMDGCAWSSQKEESRSWFHSFRSC